MSKGFTFSGKHHPGQHINWDEYIAFVRSLLQRHTFSAPLVRDIQVRVERLEKRAHDPNFYVAFVGEFNSGKSTFINALLRMELLKQSVTLRTSVPTRIQYGSQPDLSVHFAGEQAKLSFKAHQAQLQKKIRHLNPQIPAEQLISMTACLHLLTTDIHVAPYIQAITVFHKAPFLKQGTVIIDTPGINALAQSHQESTSRVLSDDADLTIITIPAYAALSGNLVNFLKSDLKPFLHRSILVLTHMDAINEQQRPLVLANTVARLKEIAPYIPQIQIYTSAAQLVLDELDPTAAPDSARTAWISHFVELEKTIWQRLSAERAAASTESLLRLLDSLLADLTTQLRQREASYQNRQTALQQEQIPDMMEFRKTKIEPYITEFQKAISAAEQDLKEARASQQAQAQSLINNEIDSASNAAGFKRIVDEEVPYILRKTSAAFKNECENILSNLERQGRFCARSIENEFSSAYQRLAQIEDLKIQMQQVQQMGTTAINAYTSLSDVEQASTSISNAEIVSAWGSVAIAGTLGTLLIPIPVVGTAVGIAIGAFVSQFIGSAESKRSKMRDALRPTISTYFRDLYNSAHTAFLQYSNNITNIIQGGITQHIHDYEGVITHIRQLQHDEQQQLIRLSQTTSTDLAAIKQRQLQLQQLQQKLRNSAVS